MTNPIVTVHQGDRTWRELKNAFQLHLLVLYGEESCAHPAVVRRGHQLDVVRP